MQAPGADVREIAHCYQGYENEMDAATVDFLLGTLEREINKHFDKETGEVTPRLSSWFELLARLAHAELIERLQYKAGSKLEALLTTVACSRVGRAGGYFDHVLHSARLLLLKIGGNGITILVNHELAQSDFYACLNGLTWALIKPDVETRRLLKAITKSNQLDGTSLSPYRQLLATRALAALHEDKAVVESVLRWGLHMPADLTDWGEGRTQIDEEKLQKAIEALNKADESAKINALLVLGISGRQDLIPRIRHVFSIARQESKVALASMITLDELRDKSSDAVRLFVLQLSVTERSVRAANALLNVGTEEALKNLAHYLCTIHRSDFHQFYQIGAELALALSKYPLTRSAALKTLWPTIKDQRWISWPHACFEAVGNLDDEEMREWLREEAFPTEGALRNVPRIASVIRGLAKFDPVAAFQAALRALRQMHCDREAIPNLLLELDADNAIPALCSHAPIERYTLTRWAIGRSLRHADKRDLVLENLKGMLQSPDPRVRQAGAELAGWQNSGYLQETLHKLCIDDMSDRVRRASREALLRQRDEEEVYRLMIAFRSTDSDQQWSLLEASIELGDPYLLNDKKDPLWLERILDGAEIALVKHAEKRLEERVKEVRSRAEKIDREMERAI